jgi:hypothetical protein
VNFSSRYLLSHSFLPFLETCLNSKFFISLQAFTFISVYSLGDMRKFFIPLHAFTLICAFFGETCINSSSHCMLSCSFLLFLGDMHKLFIPLRAFTFILPFLGDMRKFFILLHSFKFISAFFGRHD